VTALYDVVLKRTDAAPVVVRLRHKQPLSGTTAEETVVNMDPKAIAASFDAAPKSLRFAAAVAGFAEVLRKSPAAATWKLADVARIAAAASEDRAEQAELVELVRKADKLSGGGAAAKVAAPQ
jgi:Ca-activated chloride channel family protein